MPARVFLAIILATMLWGSAFPVTKMGMALCPPTHFAALRLIVAGMILLCVSGAVALVRGHREHPFFAPLTWPWRRVALIGTLTGTFYGIFYSGVNMTSSASAAAIDGAHPLMGALTAHFLLRNDRLTGRKIVALLIASVGVLVVTFSRQFVPGLPVSALGCGLILASFVINSFGSLLTITYRGHVGLLILTGLQMLIGGCLLMAISVPTETVDFAKLLTPKFFMIIAYLGAVTAVAFRLWFGVVRVYKVTSTAVFGFLTSVFGTFFSALVLGDQLAAPILVGLAFVVCGVIVMNTDRSSHVRISGGNIAPES